MAATNNPRDWEEGLSKLVGDPLAFQIGYRVRKAEDSARKLGEDASKMLSEYVHFELDLLPSASQVADFNQQVSQLEADAAQLEQRLQALFNSRTN